MAIQNLFQVCILPSPTFSDFWLIEIPGNFWCSFREPTFEVLSKSWFWMIYIKSCQEWIWLLTSCRVKNNGNLEDILEFCYATLVSLWNGNGRSGVYKDRISPKSNFNAIIITKALKLYTSFFLQIVCVFFWLKIQKFHIYFDVLHVLVNFPWNS